MIIGINGYIGSGKDTVGTIMQYLICLEKGSLMHHQQSFEYFQKAPMSNALQSGWEIKKFAGKLKQIASLMTGIPIEKFEDQEFKESYLGQEWNTLVRKAGKREDGLFGSGEIEIKKMKVREFLQLLGTDAIRNGLHENAWVNSLMADYKEIMNATTSDKGYKEWLSGEYPNWIITDCRFPNEAQAVKEKNGIIIRVNRPSKDIQTTEVKFKHVSETALDMWKFDYVIENEGSVEDLISKVKIILQERNIIS